MIEKIAHVIKLEHALMERAIGRSECADRDQGTGPARPVRSLSVMPSRIARPARVLSLATRVPKRNDARNTLAVNVLTAVRTDKMCEHALGACSDLAHVRIKHTLYRTCPSISIPMA